MWIFRRKKKIEEKKATTKPESVAVKEVSQETPVAKPVEEKKAKPAVKKTATKTTTAKKTTAKPESKSTATKKAPAKAAPKKSVYRIVYNKESRLWLIQKDGAKRTISSYATKDEALNRVKELSTSKDLGFIVHKKDGKFQKK